MTVISLSLDSTLVDRFDKVWEIEGFTNRSEAMRSAMREFVNKYARNYDAGDEEVEIKLVYSYHDTKRIRARLENVEHEHEDLIIEKQHRHVANDLCFDILTMRGNHPILLPIIGRLRAVKGIETFHSVVLRLSHDHD